MGKLCNPQPHTNSPRLTDRSNTFARANCIQFTVWNDKYIINLIVCTCPSVCLGVHLSICPSYVRPQFRFRSIFYPHCTPIWSKVCWCIDFEKIFLGLFKNFSIIFIVTVHYVQEWWLSTIFCLVFFILTWNSLYMHKPPP